MTEHINESISSLTYFTTERSIEWFQQKQKQTARTLCLYKDSITSKDHIFLIDHVHDVSYRPFSNGTGLFYLHTNRGVFTFEVETPPDEFIKCYKQIKGDPFAF